MNFFEGRLQGDEGACRVVSPYFALLIESDMKLPGDAADLILGVRPQDIKITDPADADLLARVDVVELLGSELLVHLRLPQTEEFSIRAIVPEDAGLNEDQIIGLRFRRDRLHVFDARAGERLN